MTISLSPKIQKRLDEIKSRLDKSTNGKWFVGNPRDFPINDDVHIIATTGNTFRENFDGNPCIFGQSPGTDDDAILIAHAGGENGDIAWLIENLETVIKIIIREHNNKES